MNIIGNIIWFIFGGFLTSLMYLVAGLLMCVTIVGIPFGLQLFKFAGFSFWPFGKEVVMNPASGCLTLTFNILWIIFGWWEIALMHLIFGILLGITVIGIPWAFQHFKLAKYSFLPFGCSIRSTSGI